MEEVNKTNPSCKFSLRTRILACPQTPALLMAMVSYNLTLLRERI